MSDQFQPPPPPQPQQQQQPVDVKLGVPTSFNFPTITKEQPPFPQIPEVHFTNDNSLPIRIYSHNVKNGGNHELVPGEQRWEHRVNPLVASIRFHTLTANPIITLQEVYKYQMLDIMKELNRYEPGKWEYYGSGRIDGDEIGEFVPILWESDKWELIYSDTMWLNDKDPRSSWEGWDAIYARIVSYVTLKHKSSDVYVNVFNTHFDHIGTQAQVGSAELIINRIKELNNWPSFLCGDLNIEPGSEPYKTLEKYFTNSVDIASPFTRFGHTKSTVTGFEGEVLVEGGQNIDYIFAPKYARSIDDVTEECNESTKLSLQLYQFGMLHSKYNGRYISDHRPLVADYVVKKSSCN
ncbi:hypothetical protein SBY92_003083 [Candida maltosa Xu316]